MVKYAIVVDLDIDTLKTRTRVSPAEAYTEIEYTLSGYGFSRQQGNVYFGSDKVAARRLAKYAWFVLSVRDIRMLRIEDDNDLMPAIRGRDGD